MGRLRHDAITTQRILEVYEETGCSQVETARRLGMPRSTVQSRLEAIGANLSAPKEEIAKLLGNARRFNAKLQAAGINPDLVNLDRMVVKTWDMGFKDNEGVGQTQELEGIAFYASPAFEGGPKWQAISPADGIIIKPRKPSKPERRSGEQVMVIATDPQIGYLLELNQDSADIEEIKAKLTPFHDEAAIDVALQLTEAIQPDRFIHGGDLLDNPEHTRKFRRFPEYARTTQFGVQRGHRYVAEFAQAAGIECEVTLCDGNHDQRIANDTLDNHIANYGLSPASVPGESPDETWPNNSVPNLLRLDYLMAQGYKIKYSAPYPSGRIWLNNYIMFRHDYNVKLPDQTATILHGHDHKLKIEWRKVFLRGEDADIAMVSCGSLCRNDRMIHDKFRAMSSYVPSGRFEQNWQQGIVVVHYDVNGGPNDFDIQLIKIKDGVARYAGKLFESRCGLTGAAK